jgi:prophage DNA circulation protein
MQLLAQDIANMPGLQEGVIWTWEATATSEATHAEVVRDAVDSTQRAAAVRERAEASIKEAEAWATLAKREARERVFKMEAKSAASLAFFRTEVNELTRRVAFLEGELKDERKAWDTIEANF